MRSTITIHNRYFRQRVRISVILQVALMLGVCLTTVPTFAQSEADILRQLFDTSCQNPCYLGFEPSVSTLTEIEAELQEQEINYYFQSQVLQWFAAPRLGVVVEPNSRVIAVTIENELVVQVAAPIDTTVEAVIEVFGSPEIVSESATQYSLAYPSLGFVFIVDYLRNPIRVSKIVTSLPNNPYSRTSRPSGERVDQVCTMYGSPPCVVPTATPTNMALPMVSHIQSEADILRQLFDTSCQNPCYLGFEPGVSTLTEIEAELQIQEIEYSLQSGLLQWIIESRLGVLPGANSGGVMMTIDNNSLVQTIAPIYTTVDAVIEVFGSPEIVSPTTTQYSLAYPSLGLVFIIDYLQDPNQISIVVNSEPNNPYSWTSNPSGDDVNQNCTVYGTPPCVVPTATPTSTDTPPAESDILRQLFDTSCQNPCYLDIEPGVTTIAQLQNRLQQANIVYQFEYNQMQWELPPQQLVNDGSGIPFVSVTFIDDKVAQLTAPINVSVQSVLDVFGAPQKLTDAQGRYYLIYPERGLAFAVDSLLGDSGRTDELYSTVPNPSYGIVGQPVGVLVAQTCTTFGTPPCVVPTATPTSMPLPMTSLIQSDIEILHHVFDKDCENPCYLGIEINATTLYDMEAKLQQQSIAYVYDSDQLYWDPPTQSGVTDGYDSPGISLTISDNKVIQIFGPINVSVSAVHEVFGAPTSVTEYSRAFTLTYPSLGLAFFVDKFGELNKASFVVVSSPDNTVSMVAAPPGEAVLQTCPTFGTPPCLLPSATPTNPPPTSTLVQSETDILRQLFDTSCQNPCYLGIEPGVTTLAEIEADLQGQSIEYRFEDGLLQWAAVPMTGVLQADTPSVIMVTVPNDIVIQTIAPIDTTVAAVIEVFGSPIIIRKVSTQYSLAYPALGLVFIVDVLRDPNRVTTIVNSAPNNPNSMTSNPSGENILQSCTSFDTLPCIAATATPTNPPPTSTLVQSESEILRQLFDTSCQNPCYLGIEPGVTTLAEIEADLQGQGVDYRFEDGLLQWAAVPMTGVLQVDTPSVMMITVPNDIVIQTIAPIDTTVAAVIEVFGSPIFVRKSSTQYILAYPALGLAFIVNVLRDPNRVTTIVNSAPNNPNSRTSNRSGEILQSCTSFDTLPCIAATATPTNPPPTSTLVQSESEILRQLFDTSCQNPCYLGIEPGVTTFAEIEADLKGQSIEYRFEDGLLQWAAVPMTGVLQADTPRVMMITVPNDIVIQTLAPIDTTVAAVIEVFGSPIFVRKSSTQYYLAYPALGLAFIVNVLRDPNRVTTIVNSAPNNPNSRTSNPSGENILQSCYSFDTLPCIAATATPTNTPVPLTPAPTSTPTP